MKMDFKPGDVVDIVDRRDGTVIERGVKVTAIEENPDPNLPGSVASFEGLNFRCSTRCLRPAGPYS